MGAAGSGERTDYDLAENDGMGKIVYQSYLALQQQLAQEGRTITAEAVDYPAKDVPADAGVLDWADYMGSVDAGTNALGAQYAAFTAQCPDHQGGARRLFTGRDGRASQPARDRSDPNLSAALLIADGDRHPDDTTRQHRYGVEGPGEDGRRRTGLADSGACSREPARQRSASGPSASAMQATRSVTTTRMPRTSRHRRGDSHQLHHRGQRRADVDMDGPPTAQRAAIPSSSPDTSQVPTARA